MGGNLGYFPRSGHIVNVPQNICFQIDSVPRIPVTGRATLTKPRAAPAGQAPPSMSQATAVEKPFPAPSLG